jgi:hypothetical protein
MALTAGPPRRFRKRDARYSSVAWRRVRELIRARDDRTCQACGRAEPIRARSGFPVDHKYPGGDFYDPAGLWLLCWSCNTSKGDLSVDEWYASARRPMAASAPRSGFRVTPYSCGQRMAPRIETLQPSRMTFAYHEHRWGPAAWQVQHVGFMRKGHARLDHCPPDCPLA